MTSRVQVLIASRSKAAAEAVRHLIGETHDLALETRVIDARLPDPMYGRTQPVDLLLVKVIGSSTQELEALGRLSPDKRPPLIVIAESANAECMRVAMRVGARDFLIEPLTKGDVLAAIERVTSEHRTQRNTASTEHCRVVAFLNAKGGSGATFLACNVARLLAGVSNLKTALLDLDLQFGTLPQYLDIEPKRGLLEALDVAHDLDGVAIEGYLTKHQSGLSVLAGLPDAALLQQDAMTESFEAVLKLLTSNFERLVIDLPRQIEPFSALALERADDIVLVVQQSVPSLHDATRMHDILTRCLAIPSDRVRIVVNRYRKNAAVELGDIRQALQDKEPLCIPNDFAAVTESVDMGVPIYDCARRSATTKGLMRLEQELGGNSGAVAKGFLPRMLRTG